MTSFRHAKSGRKTGFGNKEAREVGEMDESKKRRKKKNEKARNHEGRGERRRKARGITREERREII